MNLNENTIRNAIELVQTVGFPIVVALYFMLRTDKKISELTDAFYSLREEVRKK